jgi:hypothetical protein
VPDMRIFQRQRKVPIHFVRVHPDNIVTKDWVIVLEAGTIIGPSPEKLRVARWTQDKKIIKQRNILWGRVEHFIDVEGYDPRIHVVYFCPQLYKYDADKKLVPLQGEEIGQLIVRTVGAGVIERRPWYKPSEEPPTEPIISTAVDTEYDSVVVDMSAAKTARNQIDD